MKSLFLFLFASISFMILAPIVFIVKSIKLLFQGSKRVNKYWYNLALSIDFLGSSLFYGTDGRDWTISSYSHLMGTYHNSKWNKFFSGLIDFLFSGSEKNHCWNSYEKQRIELGKERGVR